MRSSKKWLGLFVITSVIAVCSNALAAQEAPIPTAEPAAPAEAKSIEERIMFGHQVAG